MAESFDPYYKWLGIPPAEQPPNHYRLLGVTLFESDLDVIANAADQRIVHVRAFQIGKHSDESQRILRDNLGGAGVSAECRQEGRVRRPACDRRPPLLPRSSVPATAELATIPPALPVGMHHAAAKTEADLAVAFAGRPSPWR